MEGFSLSNEELMCLNDYSDLINRIISNDEALECSPINDLYQIQMQSIKQIIGQEIFE